MSDLSKHPADLPLTQQSPRYDRVRPTNPFIEFKKEEIEQSISDRFEQEVSKYPDRLAVKTCFSPMRLRTTEPTRSLVIQAPYTRVAIA